MRPTYWELKITPYIMQFKSMYALTDSSTDTPIHALTDAPADALRGVLTDILTVEATVAP